jgi:hypothetical protein
MFVLITLSSMPFTTIKVLSNVGTFFLSLVFTIRQITGQLLLSQTFTASCTEDGADGCVCRLHARMGFHVLYVWLISYGIVLRLYDSLQNLCLEFAQPKPNHTQQKRSFYKQVFLTFMVQSFSSLYAHSL